MRRHGQTALTVPTLGSGSDVASYRGPQGAVGHMWPVYLDTLVITT